MTRKAAFSGWSGTTRRVFRCKSAAARCPGEHRNQDRKLVYTWRRWRQMVVTYDGVDPPLCFSLSLSPFSDFSFKSHSEYLRYGVSRFNISYCRCRGPHPPVYTKKNHVYVTCHIRHFFQPWNYLGINGKKF